MGIGGALLSWPRYIDGMGEFRDPDRIVPIRPLIGFGTPQDRGRFS